MTNHADRVREYSRLSERLAIGGRFSSLALTAGFVLSGAAGLIGRRIIKNTPARPPERIGYALAMATGAWLAGLPLSFYRGYVVEHRFDLSNQSVKDWASDQVKGETIGLAIGLPLAEGLYWTMRRWPERWWLIASGATIPITAIMAQLAPVLVLPRFFKFEPLDNPELTDRLTQLAERSGVPVAEVNQVDFSRRTTKSNAFFTGLGSTKMIALGDTLLDQMSNEEIEVVIAHELGHQVHRDIWRFIGINALYTLAMASLVHYLGRPLLARFGPGTVGTGDLADVRSAPALGLVFSTLGLFIGPIQLAYMRRVEWQADQYALDLTSNPDAFISAMEKLGASNLADPEPPRLMEILLHGHPPIGRRIEHARQWQAATASSP